MKLHKFFLHVCMPVRFFSFLQFPFPIKFIFSKASCCQIHIGSTNVVVLDWILQFEFWMYSSQRPLNVHCTTKCKKIGKQFFTQNSLENLKKKTMSSSPHKTLKTTNEWKDDAMRLLFDWHFEWMVKWIIGMNEILFCSFLLDR